MNFPDLSLIQFSYSYLPPEEPPEGAEDWPEEVDYVGVRLTIGLPCGSNRLAIMDEFLSERPLMGEVLGPRWGTYDTPIHEVAHPGQHYRVKHSHHRAPSLFEAEKGAEMTAGIILDLLKQTYKHTRDRRMAIRKARIFRANGDRGVLVRPPSE